MDFKAFDTKKIDDYTKRAKEQWGKTTAYQEYEQKSKHRSKEAQAEITKGLMELFIEFGQMRSEAPESEKVQAQVKKLQAYLTENFYTCTKEILAGLGQMYGAGGEFTENIDRAAGAGTAVFSSKAIEIYCNQ